MSYPIEQQDGGNGPAWVVWPMRVENTPGRSAAGLEVFPTYDLGRRECSRRNLQLAIERGHADDLMPALDGGRSLSTYTYREYYAWTMVRIDGPGVASITVQKNSRAHLGWLWHGTV